MLPNDDFFVIGHTYKVNPEMSVGLPVFFGVFEGWSRNVKGYDGEKAKMFRPTHRILGVSPNQMVILFNFEIRSAVEA